MKSTDVSDVARCVLCVAAGMVLFLQYLGCEGGEERPGTPGRAESTQQFPGATDVIEDGGVVAPDVFPDAEDATTAALPGGRDQEIPAVPEQWLTAVEVVDGEVTVLTEAGQAALAAGGLELVFPVANGLGSPVQVAYELSGGRIHEEASWSLSGSQLADVGAGEVRVDIETADVPKSAEDGALAWVAFKFTVGDKEFTDRRGLSTMLRFPMVVIQAPAKVYAGENTLIPVQVFEPGSRRPLAGVDVSVGATQGESVTTAHGRTGPNGEALVELSPLSRGLAELNATARPPTGMPAGVAFSSDVVEETKLLLTTDKPLYQPGQTVHIRALVLKKPRLRPLANEDFLLEVMDAKGNKVFKKSEKTNEFGIGYGTFTLATHVNMGNYTVVATAGDNRMEKTVEIRRYVLPKFKVAVDLKKDSYRPGDEVSGSLTARYFFGKAVSDGKARVTFYDYQGTWVESQVIEGETNTDGIFPFSYTLPNRLIGQPLENGNALVLAEFKVTDSADQVATANRQLPVIVNPVSVALFPESGTIVPGVKNRFHLLITDDKGNPLAARCSIVRLGGAEGLPEPFDVAGDGPQIMELIPGRHEMVIELEVEAAGVTVRKAFSFSTARRDAYVLVRTDVPIYRAGQTMVVEVIASGSVGSAFLDVTKENQTIATASIPLDGQKGRYQLDLDGSLVGSLVVSAYVMSQGGEYTRDSRVVFVEGASDILVEVTADKEQYRPADTAVLKFGITDGADNPVQAALGLQIVDEAVFALSDSKPGLMKLYFSLEKELLEPSYQIGAGIGLAFGSLLLQAATTDEKDLPRVHRDAEIALAARGDVEIGKELLNSWPAQREAMLDATRKAFQDWAKALSIDVKEKTADTDGGTKEKTVSSICEAAEKMVDANLSKSADPWGNALEVTRESKDWVILSPGMDGKAGTWDDLEARIGFHDFCPAPKPTGMVQMLGAGAFGGGGGGFGGGMMADGIGAPGAARGAKGEPRKMRKLKKLDMIAETKSTDDEDSTVPGAEEASGEEVRVRSWFPETLFVEPSLITDEAGEATLEVALADSITTWRMSTVASDAQGRLGGRADGITVFQDFFVDIDFPVFLTRNDEVEFPVAVYNYLESEQIVELRLEAGDWYVPGGSTTASLKLGPGEVKGLRFPVRVTQVGWHSLTVHAKGSAGLGDAVQRTVEVRPDGMEVIDNWSSRFKVEGEGPSADRFAQKFDFPDDTIPGSSHAVVRILPGLTTHVVQGMDSMLKLPGG